MTKYQLKNSNQTNTDIVQFLFKCLDKHGKPASVLFQNIDFSNEHIKFLHQLFSDEYSQKFDFHFINTNFHKTIYEMKNIFLVLVEIIIQAIHCQTLQPTMIIDFTIINHILSQQVKMMLGLNLIMVQWLKFVCSHT